VGVAVARPARDAPQRCGAPDPHRRPLGPDARQRHGGRNGPGAVLGRPERRVARAARRPVPAL